LLATLIIGLREGLEAALIVGIVAAFLKRSGRSLRPLAIGVTAAVLLSILVGVLLEALQTALPQSQQEALETVIGAVAVVFVTTMILWMRTHGRDMHHQLEARSEAALGRGGSLALTGMAFLAVLKEGFETAVFLLATMQAETSGALGLLGAVIGILAAGALGGASTRAASASTSRDSSRSPECSWCWSPPALCSTCCAPPMRPGGSRSGSGRCST
jgi:high-affinity iron transporter